MKKFIIAAGICTVLALGAPHAFAQAYQSAGNGQHADQGQGGGILSPDQLKAKLLAGVQQTLAKPIGAFLKNSFDFGAVQSAIVCAPLH